MNMDFRKQTTTDGRYTAEFIGKCPISGIRLYNCPECNDPRGPLGYHAATYFVASEYGMTGPDMIASWIICNNDRGEYESALRLARKQWK